MLRHSVRYSQELQVPDALISTLVPPSGGVTPKLKWLVGELSAIGIHSTLAWYEPWSFSPELSIPMLAAASGRRPGYRFISEVWPDTPGVAIGAWLPELEFTHYQINRHWRTLIQSARLHIAVTGNPLCAHRLLSSGVPFLAWVGTPWHGDRAERVQQFPWPRRALDMFVNSPVLRHQERQTLRAKQGRIIAISQATARSLEELSGRATDGILYPPPDPNLFCPRKQARVSWRVGFSGRYSDPRKQITLLLDAVSLLAQRGHPVQLELTGEHQGNRLLDQALIQRGIKDRVVCHPYLSPSSLAFVQQTWDLFVIPSHQEGLCIAAIEAMACGVPVVSTACGGPEDFVIPCITGSLVRPTPHAMAAAIETICVNPGFREHLSQGALNWINKNATVQEARHRLQTHLAAVFANQNLGIMQQKLFNHS